jgi:hypothetical protein
MRVEVELTAPKQPGQRDGIRITVVLPERLLAGGTEAIVDAATSGGVVSRVRLGSDIEVRCRPLESFPHRPQS